MSAFRWLRSRLVGIRDAEIALAAGSSRLITGSLVHSIRIAVLVAAAGWQIVMSVAVIATLGIAGWPLLLAQLLAAALPIAAVRRRGLVPFVPITLALLGLASYLASGDLDSTLVFAACWQIDFANCAGMLLILRRWVIVQVIGVTVMISTVMLVALPSWGLQFAIAVLVTQVAIVITVRLGLPSLLRLADERDAVAEAIVEAERRAELAREVNARIADESRTLHDTAINTLGAIADRRRGIGGDEAIRAQCARDTVALEALRGVQTSSAIRELRAIFEPRGIPVRRTGLDDEQIDRVAARLDARVVVGIIGCVQEAATNAWKHSGADHLRVDVAIERTASSETLIIDVGDDGVGFAADPEPTRGIEGSIRSRARDLGFVAEVSSVLGSGTAVRLEVPIEPASTSVGAPSMDSSIAARSAEPAAVLARRAGSLWGIGVTAVSLVLTVAGGANHGFALIPMIATMIAAWALAQWRPAMQRPRTLAIVLILATLVVFSLSATATSFGAEGAVHWQALAATGPFVMMLASRPGRRIVVIGGAMWVAVVIGIAVATSATSVTAAQIVVVAGCVGVGFAAMWARFQRLVGRSIGETERDRARVSAALLVEALADAARTSYQRWLEAGLDDAAELLSSIATGRRDPADEATRRACGDEESALRQLLQLGPQLVHLGHRLVPIARAARRRDIDLVMRVGSADAPDAATARGIAGIILATVETARPGEAVSASVFAVHDGLQLTVSAPRLALQEAEAIRVRHERLGSRTLVEAIFATKVEVDEQSPFDARGRG
jgi:signal transduction histidine kinase